MSEDPEGGAVGREASEPLDLSALAVAKPPLGFAERVMERVREESATPRARRRVSARAGFAVAALVAAAAVLVWRAQAPTSSGHLVAAERVEAPLGDRARVVLEAGAEVRFRGDEVEQPRGDVFYRVEPGARFRVHTPAGDVEVRGTCFTVKVREREGSMQKRDMKAGTIGAALGAIALVTVHEGSVAVSHAKESAELRAGEAAKLGEGHVVRTTSATLDGADVGEEGGWAKANRTLAEQVSDVRRRLEGVTAQKTELEARLAEAEKKLAASADGAPVRTRSDFELDAADWAELAKEGTVKYQSPCLKTDFTPTPSELDALGLAPHDGPVIREAYERSYERVWSELRPLCERALGASPEVVEKIGPESCSHLIHEAAVRENEEAAREAHTAAAEIRAKLRPEPGPNDKVHPVTKMFLVMTGVMPAFEADLARSLGPEEAHRLAYGKGLCKTTSTWHSRAPSRE